MKISFRLPLLLLIKNRRCLSRRLRNSLDKETNYIGAICISCVLHEAVSCKFFSNKMKINSLERGLNTKHNNDKKLIY